MGAEIGARDSSFSRRVGYTDQNSTFNEHVHQRVPSYLVRRLTPG